MHGLYVFACVCACEGLRHGSRPCTLLRVLRGATCVIECSTIFKILTNFEKGALKMAQPVSGLVYAHACECACVCAHMPVHVCSCVWIRLLLMEQRTHSSQKTQRDLEPEKLKSL